MLRNRNLDIVIAAIVAILGGLAAAKHMSGQITIPLGIGLFFAPGYLWSEAILSHQLPGFERAMTSAGMAFIFPIIGGFLFYALHIPLFKSSWIGLLVVLTLVGVVAVAIQRLRPVPEDQQQQLRPRPGQQRPGPGQQSPRPGGSVLLNSFVFGLAAVIALGAVGYSVKSAENQNFAPYTMFSMTPVVNNALANNVAELSGNTTAQALAASQQNELVGTAKTAHIFVENHQGVAEQYVVKLWRQGKLSNTWTVTLSEGQFWQVAVTYESPASNYAMLADLFLIPNTTTPFHYVDNGGCVANAKKFYPAAIAAEDPCYGQK
jgi:hypothetical protein